MGDFKDLVGGEATVRHLCTHSMHECTDARKDARTHARMDARTHARLHARRHEFTNAHPRTLSLAHILVHMRHSSKAL